VAAKQKGGSSRIADSEPFLANGQITIRGSSTDHFLVQFLPRSFHSLSYATGVMNVQAR
jgi:hypothetical protein